MVSYLVQWVPSGLSCLTPQEGQTLQKGSLTDIRKSFLLTIFMSHQSKPPGRVGRLSGTGTQICDTNGLVMARGRGGKLA